MKYIFFLCGLVVSLSAQTLASDWNNGRVDTHAPIGVMGEHTHETGEIMLSYRYMTMTMEGNRSGQDQKSVTDVLSDFMVSPLDMTMSMHMMGAMYAPSDRLTLMAMLPYFNKSMGHRKRDLTEFTRNSNGIGDLKMSGMYCLYKQDGHNFHLNTGISLPIGSVDEKDGQPSRLPYPMQLGSGTYDLSLGVTYAKQLKGWSYGSQLSGIFRMGENKHDYALGNRYQGTAWMAKVLTETLSASMRTQASIWDDIRGSDSDLNPSMVPTALTNRGGKQLDIAIGVNYYAKNGVLRGNRLSFEVGLPVIQSLDGVQLETDWWAVLGWQYVL
ncbi:MAG: transporter [Candidatus Margulisbacteria bacterium]|nr:transporter [Candidatus Margulisiibacteriota bacterium]